MSERERTSKDSGTGLGARIIRAGQIAAALSAVAGVALVVYNNTLKPSPAPTALVAHVKNVQARPGITQYNWLKYHPAQLVSVEDRLKAEVLKKGEPPLSTQEVDEALRNAKGVEVDWNIFLEGPAGRKFTESHTLVQEDGGSSMPIAEGPSSYWPPEAVVSEAGKYEDRQSAFVQEPAPPGTYSIAIYVKSADGSQQEEGSAQFHVPKH
jgi:hypothetical protein